MKNNTPIRRTLRTGLFCLLALAVPTTLFVLRAADKPSASTAPSAQLAKDMMGTWVLIGKPGSVREAPESGGRLKFRTGRHWTMTQANPDTGRVIMHDGGTYTLDGDRYVETLEYANPSSASDIGKSFMFTVKIEGDTMTQTGIGNPYTEVWKRLK